MSNEQTEQTAPMRTKLTTPYPDVKYGGDEAHRITIDVPTNDLYAIRCVNMEKGFTYFALQHFVKLLANECRRNKWNLDNRDDLTRFVLERCTACGVDGERPDDAQRPGANGLREEDSSTSDKSTTSKRKQAASTKQQVVE